MLHDVAQLIRRLAYRQNLSVDEIRFALNEVGKHDYASDGDHTDGLYFLALTFGLMAKGPTAAELLGFALSIADNSVSFDTSVPPGDMIDISGTGADRVKTFNVGAASSIVLAAGGVTVPKQATRSYTGFTGGADPFQEIGVDPFSLTAEEVVRCLERVGVVAFYTPAYSAGFRARIAFLTKLRRIGLTFPTPWHLVSWIYSPFKMGARLYGVYDPQYLRPLAEVFQQLGYRRALVVHGEPGLDEISNLGTTHAVELSNGELRDLSLTPDDLGVPCADVHDITTLSDAETAALESPTATEAEKAAVRDLGRLRNLRTFFEILYGRASRSKADLVAVNAGAAFYLTERTATIRAGVALASRLLSDGSARRKLHELTKTAGSMEALKKWEDELGV